MQADFYIKPLPLWQLLDKLGLALQQGWADMRIEYCQINTQLGGDRIEPKQNGSGLRESPVWSKKVDDYQSSPYLDAHSLSIGLSNNLTLSYNQGDHEHPGPFLRIRSDQNSPDTNLFRRLATALNAHLPLIPKTQVSAAALTDSQLAGFKFAETVIANLAGETAKITQTLTTSFESFVQGVKQRTLELEDQFQKKANELESTFRKKHDQLEIEHSRKLKELEEKQSAHAEEVKQFELRNNTVVRRDLLKEIRSRIEQQQKIQLSEETNEKRQIIHHTCVGTLVFSALSIGFFAWKIFTLTAFDWRYFIPLSAWTAIFVSTGIYYIRWNDQWFREHARVEFENRKLSSDILRASWLAELFFEWKEKKEVGMPSELIASLSKNLFDPASLDGKHHPFDQLNEMMKQFSIMKLGKTGVKLSRKGEKE